MPTEPMSRYFHTASSERALRLKKIIGAVHSVLASSATHSRPRWCAMMTRLVTPGKMSRHATSTRLWRSGRSAR